MDAERITELGRLRRRVSELEAELGLTGGRSRPVVESHLEATIAAVDLLPLVLEHSSDMISIHAANGDYLFVSPSCSELLGWAPDELVGCNAYELFHPEDLARVAQSHAEHQDAGEGRSASQRITYRLKTRSGGWQWVETTSRALVRERMEQIVCVTRDAQAQVFAQEALLEANRRLEHFAAGVAHDLKAPLMVISAHASLVEITSGDVLGADQRQRLGRIRHAAENMGAQIDALLTWARSGQEAQPDTETDLNELVSEVLGTLSLEITSRAARIEVGQLPIVPLDPSLGRVLIQNLVANALKYGRPGVVPVVSLRASRVNEYWDITVQDNGRGISASDQQRIFGMFQRGADAEPGGHGVGLAMCARIAELQKGTLTVESELGRGSTFHLRLPALNVQTEFAPEDETLGELAG